MPAADNDDDADEAAIATAAAAAAASDVMPMPSTFSCTYVLEATSLAIFVVVQRRKIDRTLPNFY